jgi:hypothetical protein
MVEAAANPGKQTGGHASRRLGVILDAYTVYLDLWLCDLEGHIIANGRPAQYDVAGRSVPSQPWFIRAKALGSGNDFTAADITTEPLLNGAQVATYATGVRAGGDADGELIGVLGIHFDWQPQAAAITQGLRLSEAERRTTRALLVDSTGRVIAASDGKGILTDRVQLRADGRHCGNYTESNGRLIAFHKTPGYETYAGLGWYGVIVQAAA